MIAEGKSTSAIACETGLKKHTIKECRNRIYGKLGIHELSDLVTWQAKRNQEHPQQERTPPCAPIARTCCRCGARLSAASRQYTCAECQTRQKKKRSLSSRPQRPAGGDPTELDWREKQIARMVAQAKTNQAIADELGLSRRTVTEYLYRTFRKLGIHNRIALFLWQLQQDQEQKSGVVVP